jgi:hypothetical protein
LVPSHGAGASLEGWIGVLGATFGAVVHQMRWPTIQIEAERATVPSSGGAGSKVCRMHGAGGGAPKGNRNALKHGGYTAETIKTQRMVVALAKQARELVETI